MFTIEKDLSGIFWHIYNNARTRVNVSDFDVVIDSISQTFIIQCKNGSNIPSQAIAVSLMQVIDLSVGTSPIAFSGAEGLIQLLMAKNYTPYLQDAPSESVYVYRVGQVGVFTMTPTQFTDNFTETGLGRNTMLGWALRNGSNGTKNQQGKFSLNKGASPYDVIGAIGGSPNAVLIGHKHTFNGSAAGATGGGSVTTGNQDEGAGSFFMNNTGLSENGVSVPDQTGVGKNMPPYLIDVWVERVSDLIINSGSGGGGGGGVQTVTGVNVTGTPTDRVVGVPTLQQVTGEDNETTNDIIVKDSENKISLQPRNIRFDDIDEGGSTSLRFINTDATDQEIEIRGLGGTMALTSDIPTLVAGTNITIDDADPLNPIISASGGGGGSQTLAQTLELGNETDGFNILVNNADAIELENGSLLKKGTYDFGGNGGISRICSNNYEDMWQNGFRHVFDQSGFIRNSTNCFNIIPDETFDVTLRFAVGSFWSLDNGTTYVCTDNTEGAAVWELYATNVPTLQEVTDEGNVTTNSIIFEDSVGLQVETGIIDGASAWYFQLLNVGNSFKQFISNSDNTDERVAYFPDKTGTIAFLDDIPTLTSQLTNDGADGVNPFITALDIPTTGQASTLVREVKNMTGATLTKGTVVYISGANGNKALVSKALATTDALSARTFGLLQSNILNNGLGNCVVIGDLSGINTSAFAEGAQLYLSGTVAGAFTDVRTLAPTHLVYVGKVTRSHPTQGQIEVQIQNGYELEEIHDVQIITPLNNQTILYETSSELWKNKTIIEDSIANGITDVAPSQNAVFDALALKQNSATLIFDSIQKAIMRDNYFWFIPNAVSTGISANFGFSERIFSGSFALLNNGTLTRGMIPFNTTIVPGILAFSRRNDALILTGLEVVFSRKIQFNSNVSGQRFFSGISKGNQFAAPTNVEPSTLTDIVGVCQLSTSTNMHIVHNDASGTATTIDLGSSYPCTDSQYNYYITIEQTTTTYIVTVERVTVTTGASISTTSTLATNIPNYATGTIQLLTWISNNASAAIASYLDGGAIGNVKNQ
jgi:hypothetical protein